MPIYLLVFARSPILTDRTDIRILHMPEKQSNHCILWITALSVKSTQDRAYTAPCDCTHIWWDSRHWTAVNCDKYMKFSGGQHSAISKLQWVCCCHSTCCISSFLMAVLAVRCSDLRMLCSSFLCHWGIVVLATTWKTVCFVKILNCN